MEDEMGQCISMPRLGEKAPDFEAPTTHGVLKLSDFKGKWLVLFSHPADFTPVCTTEFIAFSAIADELKSLNVQLMGLSIDSVHSHLAWIRNVKEKMGVDIPFPIIADLDMNVAKKYGMIHPGQSSTAAIRAVFFIDDKGILRAMIYYPLYLINGNAALSAMFAIGIFLVNAVIASWNIQGTIEGFHDPKFKKWPFAFRACAIASILLALASVLITGGA